MRASSTGTLWNASKKLHMPISLKYSKSKHAHLGQNSFNFWLSIIYFKSKWSNLPPFPFSLSPILPQHFFLPILCGLPLNPLFPHSAACLHGCKVIYWRTSSLSGTTSLSETASPLTSSHELPMVSQLGMGQTWLPLSSPSFNFL